jgi:hypothetical protein
VSHPLFGDIRQYGLVDGNNFWGAVYDDGAGLVGVDGRGHGKGTGDGEVDGGVGDGEGDFGGRVEDVEGDGEVLVIPIDGGDQDLDVVGAEDCPNGVFQFALGVDEGSDWGAGGGAVYGAIEVGVYDGSIGGGAVHGGGKVAADESGIDGGVLPEAVGDVGKVGGGEHAGHS